ncbi:MAG TPA: SIS domain-containing protein [Solirubrobacteraceae bacterium]|jgi:fructoselysine-6-P-deglycase FrlB-like protein|nr:SIS domain-containing protein [Solirubrobacteraceae bacterium]
MSVTREEISSQPQMWRQVTELLPQVATQLPAAGERVAVVGCGTSYFIAQAVAAARESGGRGETDAFVASEMPAERLYDLVLAISRSGTTTEVVRCLEALPSGVRSLAVSAMPGTPVVEAAHDAIVLAFADETSIVQTRFATTALALLRAHLGHDLSGAIADAQAVLDQPLPADPAAFEHFVFLGHGWTVGLAAEAALKFREAGQAWAESYPAMEYRHGPISVAGPGSLVWFVGDADPDLVRDVRATGATVVTRTLDPMAELVALQRGAVALAEAKGLDPDNPQHLTRSVVLG